MIDAKDKIFSSLRLWIDKNHNAVSEPDELFTLPDLDVVAISLNYTKSQKADQYGNLFRYKSTIVGSSPLYVARMWPRPLATLCNGELVADAVGGG